jgi:hypothetical protein
MNSERQPTTLYSLWGEPSSLEDWVVQGASFDYFDYPFWLKLQGTPDPFGFNNVPQYQVQHVAANGLMPAYEGALLAFSPHDQQHYVRLTRVPKVLAWLGNDALAKDDLKHAAEIHRMSFRPQPNHAGNGITGADLYGMKAAAQANPNHGIAWGRGESWGLDAVLAAYSLNDEAYRSQVRPWIDACADVVALGQASCSGFIQSKKNSKWLGGLWRTRSSPEQAITENALWGLKETVYRGEDIARFQQTEHVLAESTKAMIGPMAWSGFNAPWYLLATGDLDPSVPPYCGSVPSGGAGNGPDNFQTWCSMAYGYELTGDPDFLQKAAQMHGTSDLLQAMKNAGMDNMVNKAALMAVLQ